jgi:hypothetical protein
VGGKYIDAFGVANLDLQAEWNRVRPFTYSHYDSISNYTHDNQPLAHPLGANFNEFLGSLRYQFAPKWMVLAKAMFYKQGRDTGSVSFGSNIFLPNGAPYRTMEYGYELGGGALAKVGYASFLLSYQFRPNLFFEANAVLRQQNAYGNVPSQTPPSFMPASAGTCTGESLSFSEQKACFKPQTRRTRNVKFRNV